MPPKIDGSTLAEVITANDTARIQQPWLNQFPMLLKDMLPVRTENEWILRAPDGHFLSMGTLLQAGWKLLALGAGRPLTIFGEWDGARLLPLNVWLDNRIVLL